MTGCRPGDSQRRQAVNCKRVSRRSERWVLASEVHWKMQGRMRPPPEGMDFAFCLNLLTEREEKKR
jgi:hypothetical protein